MNPIITPENKHFFVDREAVKKALAEVNEAMGFVPDYSSTPEEVQEYMISLGIRPEDNICSRGIIAARDGKDDWDE